MNNRTKVICRFLIGSLLTLILLTPVLWYAYLRTTSYRVMDAIYKYNEYEEFLKNVRGLQEIMTEDAYFVINQDTFSNTQKYIRLSEFRLDYAIIESHISLNGEVILVHKIQANKIDASRNFIMRLKIKPFKIYEIQRGEILNI